ncbi:hypothetical protein LCGC14_1086330 [marine sediment metagenome]|uniref:Uncharacterized protein n=1 Tax=marine sediment metagenome TaxID=412755 RepID=A0A0F9N1B4_9ZZZZ
MIRQLRAVRNQLQGLCHDAANSLRFNQLRRTWTRRGHAWGHGVTLGLVLSAALAACGGSPSVSSPTLDDVTTLEVQRWTPTTDDRTDALNYFLGTQSQPGIGNQGPTRALVLDWWGTNDHGFVWWCKVPTSPPACELYEWDRDWIYHRADRSHGTNADLGFTQLRWMPRRVTPGWTETMQENEIFFYESTDSCEVAALDSPICPQWMRDTGAGPDCRRGFPSVQSTFEIDEDRIGVGFVDGGEFFTYDWRFGWVGWQHPGKGHDIHFPTRVNLGVPGTPPFCQ